MDIGIVIPGMDKNITETKSSIRQIKTVLSGERFIVYLWFRRLACEFILADHMIQKVR
jgi:uncharacterized membrane protein